MFEDILKDLKIDGSEKIELNRTQKAFLYVIDLLNSLVDNGLMKGKVFKIAKEAYPLFENFEPTEKEITEVILFMKKEGYID